MRAEDELAWPPLMTGSTLGGAAPPAGAIDVPCHAPVDGGWGRRPLKALILEVQDT